MSTLWKISSNQPNIPGQLRLETVMLTLYAPGGLENHRLVRVEVHGHDCRLFQSLSPTESKHCLVDILSIKGCFKKLGKGKHPSNKFFEYLLLFLVRKQYLSIFGTYKPGLDELHEVL